MGDMRRAIRATLDGKSRKRLAARVEELGWTPLRVLREALRPLEANHVRRRKRGIIGLGECSRVRDLGSNKRRLYNFEQVAS